MKYLQDYLTEKQSKLFEKYGVFFAFNNDQWDEAVDKTIDKKDYSHIMSGMYCPTKNAAEFIVEHALVVKAAVEEDIAENGLNLIIRRELSNHECYYTGDIDDAVDKLVPMYPVTVEDIWHVFKNKQYEVPLQRESETNRV